MEAERFDVILDLLKKITVPKKDGRRSRRGFAAHRAMTLGIVKGRFNGIIGLSSESKKYPLLYEEICKLGREICPFEFNSIHLNNNVVCPKHFDSKNVGESLLISFGDYTGCNIVIEGVIHDAKYNPIVFNGALKEHWNTDDLVGNKYSLVFYSVNVSK
tara:strand:- start:850 stop:1326 length:477 start_codon:yes stop_codon:yes gene_type:complete